MLGYRDLIYLTLQEADSHGKQVLAPMLVLEEPVPQWSDFAGDDVEFEWLCDAIAVKVDRDEVPLFRIQVTFTRPRQKEFTFYFNPTSDAHRRWLSHLADAERFALLDPGNTNALVNPWVSLKGSSVRKLLDGIDSGGRSTNAPTSENRSRKCWRFWQ